MDVLNHAFYEGNRLKQEYRQTFTAIDMDLENTNLFSREVEILHFYFSVTI